MWIFNAQYKELEKLLTSVINSKMRSGLVLSMMVQLLYLRNLGLRRSLSRSGEIRSEVCHVRRN